MGVLASTFALLGFSSPAGDESLRIALEEFDWYSQHLMMAVDPQWDPATRMHNVEYCAFLDGAALAIVRGHGQEDAHSTPLLGRYLSRFMDWEFSVGWLLNCQAELSRSPRLQGVQAAGVNTAQAVWLANRGQPDILRRPDNFQRLMKIFAEVRHLMEDRAACEEHLLATSRQLSDSVSEA